MNKIKSKSTQKKWIMSVAAVLICIAMLAGTTLAWFTDTDSATLNSIKAGNLDIELKHAVTTSNGTTYEDVDEDTVLFTANNDGETQILWEPGVLAYEVFQASNVGNLALQYKSILSVAGYNTVTDEDGTARSLADVLKVAVYSGTYSSSVDIDSLTFYDFDEIASASASGVLLSEYEAANQEENAETTYSSADTFSLIIYWEPSGLDNYYNLNNSNTNSDGSAFSDGQEYLWISLGITLTATQYDYEYDSFTDQYDANATYAPAASVTQLPASSVNVFTNTSGSYSAYEADVLYLFSALDDADTAAESEYADWNVDFEVSFNSNVTNVPVIGYYSSWVSDLGVSGIVYVPITLTLDADTTTRLLKDQLGSVLNTSSVTITYEELCENVGDFYCGVSTAYNSSNVTSGTVMTVNLVLYETDSSSGSSVETGESVMIATYTYTFE